MVEHEHVRVPAERGLPEPAPLADERREHELDRDPALGRRPGRDVVEGVPPAAVDAREGVDAGEAGRGPVEALLAEPDRDEGPLGGTPDGRERLVRLLGRDIGPGDHADGAAAHGRAVHGDDRPVPERAGLESHPLDRGVAAGVRANVGPHEKKGYLPRFACERIEG